MHAMSGKGSGRPAVIEIIYAPLIGGSETLALDLCRRWKAEGIPVRICCLYEREGALTALFDRAGIPYDLLDIGGRTLIGRWFAVGRYLLSWRPRAVHVHHFGLLVNVFIPAYLTGCSNVVFTEHSSLLISQRRWMRKMLRFTVRFVRKMTCVSSALVEYFDRLGVPSGKMAIVYNGVDTGRFRPPADPRAADGPVRIVAVGRMVEEKDYPLLLKALAELKRAGLAFVAEVVGDGPLAPQLRHLHAALDLGAQVRFLGRCEDIPEILRRSDIYVLSSKSEGMPIALLEAMATALPVVATAVDAVPEVIVDGINGLLVPPGDPRALAAALARLIADPELRARIGARGLRDVRTLFSIESTTQLYAEHLGIAR